MSIYHALADTEDHLNVGLVRTSLEVAMAVTVTAVGALRVAVVKRLTARRLERLSDHMLRDFGFERDWDGTIRALRDAD